MSKLGRTYAVVKWNPGFDRNGFARAKAQGVIETSHDLVRKNLSGTEAVLKWRGLRPTEISPGLVIWEGDHAEILKYLAENKADWVRPMPNEIKALEPAQVEVAVSWEAVIESAAALAVAGAAAAAYFMA